MNSNNPMLRVRQVYETAQHSFKIAERATKTQEPKARQRLLQRTHMETSPVEEAIQMIEKSANETDALFVLAMWATFERFLRQELQIRGRCLCLNPPPALGQALYEHFEKEVEFWKPGEILDFLKNSLFNQQTMLIGHAKQILAYRDWVAHGKNPNRPPPTDLKPLAAYKTLNDIVETLLRCSPVEMISSDAIWVGATSGGCP